MSSAESGASPRVIADLSDYAREAPSRMSAMAWEYINGGSADELSLRWNEEAYSRIRLTTRVLTDVSQLDTRLTLLGRQLDFPILLAPVAYHRLAHPEGELATVRGADLAGALLIASTVATTSIEKMAAVAKRPLWFQLYVQPDRTFTADIVRRAEAAGCEALVLTVDSPVLGTRYRETRTSFALPLGMERENLRGLSTAGGAQRASEQSIFSGTLDPKLAWKDIAWLRSVTKLPIILKGILHPEDAAMAVEHGAAAVIVSNHGGRNLDTVPATIDALPAVAQRVASRIPVLVDGGIRRGTSVFKALALGATAVLIGRPYIHGLAVGGAEGVARVVNLLRRELECTMALAGKRSLKEIDASVLWK